MQYRLVFHDGDVITWMTTQVDSPATMNILYYWRCGEFCFYHKICRIRATCTAGFALPTAKALSPVLCSSSDLLTVYDFWKYL